jgi:transposase
MVNSDEWRAIAPLLPPNHGPGKARLDDRLMLSAFYYAEATQSSLECLPAAYGNPRSLRTRRQHWEADGTLARLMEVGKPVIERMKIGYLNLICGASLRSTKHERVFRSRRDPEIAPCPTEGRYATRQRAPAG